MKQRIYIIYTIPAILLVLAFTAYPAVYGIWMSFTDIHLSYPGWSYVGIENYQRLLSWPPLSGILLNTFIFLLFVVAIQIIVGLIVALALNEIKVFRRFFRSMAILPWVLPPVIIALTYRQFFSGSQLGFMNVILADMGLPARSWLANPIEAMAILIGVMGWRGFALTVILQLGGLQTINHALYEAASIDGANAWQKFRYITLPSLKPILLINLILVTAGVLNHVDIPLGLTSGGPGRATEMISLTLYKQGFQLLDTAFAATIATVMLAVNLALTIIYIKLLKGKDNAS
jgi:ABC-type sugar transport system permease subunit